MIADFDAAPVFSNRCKPLRVAHGLDGPGTEVVAGQAILGVLECCRVPPYADDGFDMGEVDVERIDRAQRDVVVIYASVCFLATGKRGEMFWVSFAAKQWTVFWLSLA